MRPRVFLIALLIATPMSAADDFYEQQLRAGKADFQASRLAQAADEFRIAAFGLMQQPPRLQEALARLAIVENALGQNDELKKTIDRFVVVEQRFPSYANADLEPLLRSRFEDLVVKVEPKLTLQTVPTLASLANYDFVKIGQMPPSQRVAAYEAGAQREPKNLEWVLALVKEADARDDANAVVKWGTKALELDSSNNDVKLMLAHARAIRRECKEALAIIHDLDPQQHPQLYADQTVCFAEIGRWKDAQQSLASVPDTLKSRSDVNRAAQNIARALSPAPQSATAAAHGNVPMSQASSASPKVTPTASQIIEQSRKLISEGRYEDAVKLLRPATRNDAENRPLKLALLEASVLARDWRGAASQVPVVTPLSPGEELYMFYASVALYETGRHDEAKLFMEKARPRMVPSPMVDYYVKTILGQQRGS